MLGDPETPEFPQPGPAQGRMNHQLPAALNLHLCDRCLSAAFQLCQGFQKLLTGVRHVVP